MSKSIILTEEQFKGFVEHTILTERDNNIYKQYSERINQAMQMLENALRSNGTTMINIRNGKYYKVLSDERLSNLIGREMCVCQLLRDNDLIGMIAVKPLSLFKISI
jgi:hypothetical protein